MLFSEDIRAAINSHVQWRRELAATLTAGTSVPSQAQIARDDLCEFGRWLRRFDHGDQGPCGGFLNIVTLHARVHLEAAEAVRFVELGQKDEAMSLLADTGVITRLSNELMMLMAARGIDGSACDKCPPPWTEPGP